MEWNKQLINTVVQEMIQENPLACRALLKICTIQFSEKVPTLSVSLAQQPVLYINLKFCNEHLQNDNDLKAVLLHEFLHVLLLHTEKYKCNTPLLNLCLDAVINAIIFRMQGMEYAGFFARYYPWKQPFCLLRPQTDSELPNREWRQLHQMIYAGRFAADQLLELLEYMQGQELMKAEEDWQLIGTHPPHEEPSEKVKEILKEIMVKMQGVKIWSKKKHPGIGSHWENKVQSAKASCEQQQKMEYWNAIQKCLLDSTDKRVRITHQSVTLPILTTTDKRSISKFISSSLIPYSTIELQGELIEPSEKFQLYLDVSGSMEADLEKLLSVLIQFRNFISFPVWSFSDEVRPAEFKNGKLCYETSYGTNIYPVLEHYAKHRFKKALIVTDGYFGAYDPDCMNGINLSGLRALVLANGHGLRLEEISIPYIQLKQIKEN
jgi:hypothetical protein